MFIYKITNKINGKIYVGQTIVSAKKRFKDHINKSRKNSKSALHRAIKKYGENNFTINIIDTANSIDELNQKEIDWIITLNTVSPSGYNLQLGGGNRKQHQETKNKLSINRSFLVYRKNEEFVGEWTSEKQCATDLGIGRSHICSCLNNTRIITYGYIFCFKDELHSLNNKFELAKKRFHSRPKHIEIKKNKKWKEFEVYDKDGILIGKWMNPSQCARDLNLHSSNVRSYLNNKTKCLKGFTFKYVNLISDIAA